MLRGDRVWEAHRSHAYQCLARRWSSHKSVYRSESDASHVDGGRRVSSYSAPCNLGRGRSARDPLIGANYGVPACFSGGFDTPASLTSCYLSSKKRHELHNRVFFDTGSGGKGFVLTAIGQGARQVRCTCVHLIRAARCSLRLH